jgi:phosphatidate cytidylyltransferase
MTAIKPMSNHFVLKTLLLRSLSGAVYVATILIPLLFLPELFPFVIALYGLIALREYYMLTFRKRLTLFSRSGSACTTLFWASLGFIWLIFPFALLALMPVIADRLYPGSGPVLTMVVFLLVWVNDTFAYLVGRAVGKHPLAPSVSPAKTVEGAVGGAVFAVFGALLLMTFVRTPLPGTLFWIPVALMVALLANIGDLAESKLKRMAGVKDSGSLIPGHGGVFDRFDAVMLVTPFWMLLLWLCSLCR